MPKKADIGKLGIFQFGMHSKYNDINLMIFVQTGKKLTHAKFGQNLLEHSFIYSLMSFFKLINMLYINSLINQKKLLIIDCSEDDPR